MSEVSAADDMTCWVLTEGMPGTENQCLGLAEAVGLQPVVKRARPAASWSWWPWHRPSFERLAPESDSLAPPWPDVLIAGGRKCIGLALAVRRAAAGQTFAVFVQNPGNALPRFDMVIVPQHDGVRGANAFVIRGALNRVTPERLAAAAARAAPRLAHLPRPYVAVLIGGTTRRHRLDPAAARRIATRLAAMAAGTGAGLAVTASRRTGRASFAALKAGLGHAQSYVWDGEGENPYFGFLGLADAIVVTGDSVSMTSEACATGKPVYVIPLKGRGSRRFHRFFEGLETDGLIRPFTGALDSWGYAPLRDTAEAAAELRRRLAARDLNPGEAAP